MKKRGAAKRMTRTVTLIALKLKSDYDEDDSSAISGVEDSSGTEENDSDEGDETCSCNGEESSRDEDFEDTCGSNEEESSCEEDDEYSDVRNNHVMDMSLCHEGVLVEHECACESRRVRVRRVGACRTIIESEREREFVPPQPLVVWG
jgi:hypothetical protein